MTAPRTSEHHTPDGVWHIGPVYYCHLCTPPPNPTLIPVVPASRRGDYTPPTITTQLADRGRLARLCDAYSHQGAPRSATTERLENPTRGTAVLFSLSARVWAAGIVETTGYAGIRVAYIHPRELARARERHGVAEVRRARPSAFFALPEEA